MTNLSDIGFSAHQWIVMGSSTLLVTEMTTVSPAFTCTVGPGNILFMAGIGTVMQARVTFWVSTCTVTIKYHKQRTLIHIGRQYSIASKLIMSTSG